MHLPPQLSSYRTRSRLRLIAWALPVFLLFSTCISARSDAQGNPMLVLLKNSVYGGACGLLLGGVLTLVVDKEDRSDVVRWGTVVGTFTGFGYGVYELSTGDSWEEFTHRAIPDAPSQFAAGNNGHHSEGPGFDPGSVAVPLRLHRALGRSSSGPAARESRQRPAIPGFRLIAAEQN